jgi:hypothetical protein
LEHQADDAATAALSGGKMSPLAAVGAAPSVQREDKPLPPLVDDQKPKSDDDKYKEAAGKVAEAFLKTKPGEALLDAAGDAAKNAAKPFSDATGKVLGPILAGVTLVGPEAVGLVVGLVKSHKELPFQLPDIPVGGGLKVGVKIEGPLNAPTSATITFSYEAEAPKKKDAGSAYAAETAKMKAENDKFKANTTYKPGSKEALDQEAQKKDEQAAVKAYMLKRYGPLGTGGGFDLEDFQKKYPGVAKLGSAGPDVGSYADWKKRKEPPSMVPQLQLDPELEKKIKDMPVQKKERGGIDVPSSDALARIDETVGSNGSPLDAQTRSFMQDRFGHDFSAVRIHADATGARSSRAVNARAWTSGNHIAFDSGEFSPHTSQGKRLLAHELAHVVQQGHAPRRETAPRPPAPAQVEPAAGRKGRKEEPRA